MWYNLTMKFLFDCDDTLYDLSWPFRCCIEDFQMPIESKDLLTFYACYRQHGDAIFPLVQEGRMSVDESGAYRIQKACQDHGIEMTKAQALKFQERYRFYQSKIQMSSVFHQFFSTSKSEMAVLTNGEDGHQRNKVHTLRVTDYIPEDHIFTSGQIGYRKPDSKAFQYVMDSLQDQPQNWLYIGDSYINDMEGAKKAGLHTLYFNRHHQMEGPCAEHIVYTEEQLIKYLMDLEGRETDDQRRPKE